MRARGTLTLERRRITLAVAEPRVDLADLRVQGLGAVALPQVVEDVREAEARAVDGVAGVAQVRLADGERALERVLREARLLLPPERDADVVERPGQEKRDSTSLQRECSARARSANSTHASRPFREMIARPKISRNEWKTAEIGEPLKLGMSLSFPALGATAPRRACPRGPRPGVGRRRASAA